MSRGVYLTHEGHCLLVFTVKTLNYNDEDVFSYLFGDLAVGSRPSQHYVNDLCARIRVMSIDE